MINTQATFSKYKENLKIVETANGIYIKSYDTLVAQIDYESNILLQLGWWSMTTQKHINYAANELNLQLVKTPFKL